MWTPVPETIERVLWQGQLQPEDETSVSRTLGALRGQGSKEAVEAAELETALRDLPVVSIGEPQVIWRSTDPPLAGQTSAFAPSLLNEADFYLVRMACSFRPARNKSEVEWARFLVHLQSDDAGRQPIAFDLYPLEVNQEVKQSVKVSLGPSLKFHEVEAKLGQVDVGFEYPELQPRIGASGGLEPRPSWDYARAEGAPLLGSKWMHLLVKAPKGMAEVRATLDLVADVLVYKWRIPVVVIGNEEQAKKQLTVRIA